jgi:hypothetical protein
MFERAVDQILDKYMFDPVQFYLVTIDGVYFLRYQYFGRQETTKEISLAIIDLPHMNSFIKEVEERKFPTRFEMRADSTTYSFEVKKRIEENMLSMSFNRKFMGVPISWLSFKGQQKDLLRLANGLANVA